MNRTRVFAAIEHVERVHSRGLDEHSAQRPATPQKPMGRGRILAASPEMLAALARRVQPAPQPKPTAPLPKPVSKASPKPAKPQKAATPPAVKPSPAPPKADRQNVERRARRRAAVQRAEALLRQRYPAAFCPPPRPLAVGVHRQIRAAIDSAELSSRDLSAFLAGWTRRPAYRAALERGERRVNLDGSDAGPAFDRPKEAAQ